MKRRKLLILPVGASVVITAALVVWGRLPARKSLSHRAQTRAVAAAAPTGEYVHRTPALSQANETKPWAPPARLTNDGEWVFDVFTPPEIRYDPVSQRFTVKAPTLLITSPKAVQGSAFLAPEIELVEIKRRPFRLQLVGFAETPKATLGLFEVVATSETVFAGVGRQIPELDLTIVSLEVRTADPEFISPDTTRQRMAVATVRQGRTGEVTTLTTAVRCLEKPSRAVLSWGKDPRVIREVGTGEHIEVNGLLCEVADISTEPATVTLVGKSADSVGKKIVASSLRTASEPTPSI